MLASIVLPARMRGDSPQLALALSESVVERTAPTGEDVLRVGALPRTVSGMVEPQAASSLGRGGPLLVFGPTPTAVVLEPVTRQAASLAPTPEALPPYHVHVVVQGDTASSVAARYHLRTESIIWSNPEVNDADNLAIGQHLLIPAADGVLHQVRYGETLGDIAERYGVKVDAILAFSGNHISSADDISEQETVFIPGGEPPAAAPQPQPTLVPATATPTEPPSIAVSVESSGSAEPAPASSSGSSRGLIWPVSGPISSYYGPSHPLGIDIDMFANPTGPVAAATSGTVIFAGGNPCCSYGLYVEILSPGGIQTLYGHLSSIDVSVGETVAQGQIIGNIGCTGYCTGPHLHFEVVDNGVRVDPLAYLP